MENRERYYPQTKEYCRSKQELRNYKIYGNERDDVHLVAWNIKYSMEDALFAFVFSIKQGIDCKILYDKMLKDLLETIKFVATEDEMKVIEECDTCFRNNIQISPEQCDTIFQMISRGSKNMAFIMEYLKISGKDHFDIRPKFWLEDMPDEFCYKYTYKDMIAEGYKLTIKR